MATKQRKRTKQKKRIPLDVLSEILKRVPSKFLIQCMLVCKDWLGLIRHQNFCRLHLSYSRAKPAGTSSVVFISYHPADKQHKSKALFMTDDQFVYTPRCLRAPRDHYFVYFKGCSNILDGLIFLYGVCSIGKYRHIHSILYNITTGERREVPEPTLLWRDSEATFALGFDRASNKYKLLCLVLVNRSHNGNKEVVDCKVLTLESGKSLTWTKLSRLPNTTSRHRISNARIHGTLDPVYFDGKIYCNKFLYTNNSVLFFDPSTERFGSIAAPNDSRTETPCYVVEVGGELCFIMRIRESDYRQFLKYWVLDNNNWSEKGTIEITRGLRDSTIHHPELMGRISTGEILLLESDHSKFYLYDTNTSKIVAQTDYFSNAPGFRVVPISCNHVENIFPFSSIM